MVSILLVAALAQVTGTDFVVDQANRLAITPKIDGTLEAEEWDRLGEMEGLESFLQWEPGSIFIGGRVPRDRAARISLDLNGDGWLVGDDNIEIIVANPPRVRRMIANPQVGGSWDPSPLLQQALTVETGTGGPDAWAFELRMIDAFGPRIRRDKQIGVRVEPIAVNEADAKPWVPRRTALVRLALDRSRGLPEGVVWAPEMPARSVTPGQGIRLRLTFRNPLAKPLERIELRSLGRAAAFTGTKNQPFPNFDRRNRAFIDYEAKVAEGAPTGWTLLTARIASARGEALIQSSYLITDPLTLEPDFDLQTGKSGEPRIIRGSVSIRSHQDRGFRGQLKIAAPAGWAVRRGHDARFSIFNERGTTRVPVEFVSVQGAQGLIPIRVTAVVGEREFTTTGHVVLP